ncbi:MAG: hypothetical protein O6761_06810 [Thaumarchaeota archaeon]|nr:hypothetical protein [Nitrososphaerota archaeon]
MLLEKQFYEQPQVIYLKSSGSKYPGGLGIRFDNKYGFTSQYVDLKEKICKLYLPFKGREKKCWDCGGERQIVIKINLEGNLIEFDEACDLPFDPHGDHS